MYGRIILYYCIVFAGLKARVPISTKIGSSKPFPKLPSPQLYERWSHHHAAREARHSSAAFMEFFGDQTRKLGLTMARSCLWSRACLDNLTKHSRTVRQWTTQKMCVGCLFNKQNIPSNKITTTKVPRIDSKPPVQKSCFQCFLPCWVSDPIHRKSPECIHNENLCLMEAISCLNTSRMPKNIQNPEALMFPKWRGYSTSNSINKTGFFSGLVAVLDTGIGITCSKWMIRSC